ncbi:hypothetical protein CAPTEDRAFT_217809 [Capitella teleta]|uniref:Uncharacterized protein n=1 Tax=Capitella teleta TaxID=283909 RepID=R7TMV6_CAPTE|nr:hypothetical protein CAPTEDRAFT_217809 [Capitella teleta]|eukprot:ELT94974.1 hypothetical protein CAPTEDRAFT_217809 [Capitella teleta]
MVALTSTLLVYTLLYLDVSAPSLGLSVNAEPIRSESAEHQNEANSVGTETQPEVAVTPEIEETLPELHGHKADTVQSTTATSLQDYTNRPRDPPAINDRYNWLSSTIGSAIREQKARVAADIILSCKKCNL